MNKQSFAELIETLQAYYNEADAFLTNITAIDPRLMEYTVHNTYCNNMGLMFDAMLKCHFGDLEDLIAWYIMEKRVLNTQFDEEFEINSMDDLMEYIISISPEYFGE